MSRPLAARSTGLVGRIVFPSRYSAIVRSAETPTTKLTLRDDGVLAARGVNSEIPRTAETVHVVMDALSEIAGDVRRPVLWDIRGSTIGRPESMQVFVGRAAESMSAIALLIDAEASPELSSRIEAFSPVVDVLLMPVRVFSEESEASAWLQSFVGRNPT